MNVNRDVAENITIISPITKNTDKKMLPPHVVSLAMRIKFPKITMNFLFVHWTLHNL